MTFTVVIFVSIDVDSIQIELDLIHPQSSFDTCRKSFQYNFRLEGNHLAHSTYALD